MSHTIRWFHKKENRKRLRGRAWFDGEEWHDSYWNEKRWTQLNPYYYKHDDKKIRVHMNRTLRHKNKIRIKKGMDILDVNTKSKGWETL